MASLLQWTPETILIVLSGLFTLLSLPQLIIGIIIICKMRKLFKIIFWTSLLSLLFAYSVIASIFLLSAFVTFISPPFSSDLNPMSSDNTYASYLVNTNRKISPVLPIGVSVIEFLFISCKTSINLLFLCRLYYSFKCTVFRYSIRQLSPLFILIIIELIIYLLYSDIIFVHIPHKYHLHRTFGELNLNKIFLTAYHCLEILIRVSFILLFERGLYRLATARSLRSNLRLFGFGGVSIDQIELSCKPDAYTPSLKVDVTPKPIQNEHLQKDKQPQSRSNSNHQTLHPLSYQATERDDNARFDITSFPIPEENETDKECLNEIEYRFIGNCPTTDEDEDNNNNNENNKHKTSTTSTQSDSSKPSSSIDTIHAVQNSLTITINHGSASAPKTTRKPGHVLCHSNEQPSPSVEQMSVTKNTPSTRNRDRRSSSQIDDLLSMSQMGSNHNRKTSFAVKYLNESTFDPQTLDLVTLVTKFSVLVVWSTVISTFAAVFWISFVFEFNDNKTLQHLTSSYIALVPLIICFVELHVAILQLKGLAKWYTCLCGCCHNTWRKCCICKLRCRLVRKIGKQHKAMTEKEAEKQGQNKKSGNESQK